MVVKAKVKSIIHVGMLCALCWSHGVRKKIAFWN